jgi:hypothetical protein
LSRAVAGIALAACLLPVTAGATPYVPRREIVDLAGEPWRPAAAATGWRAVRAIDPVAHFDRVAAFERAMQAAAPYACPAADPVCFGGMIEVETGPGFAIVQSDNTQEAVWIWSRWRLRSGEATYAEPVAAAWGYLDTHPGWMEEGAPGEDYYRAYNCAWGILAALAHAEATGDVSREDYLASCVAFVRGANLPFVGSSVIEPAVAGWAAAALYRYGVERADGVARADAAALGNRVKGWLQAGFAARVPMRAWAVTGGAALYGVMESYLREHPEQAEPWLALAAPHLGGFVDAGPAGTDWTDWRNAHSAWNMLGHLAASRGLGGPDGELHRQAFRDLADRLADQDTDLDGGIPGSVSRPATEDQSWITSYLAAMAIVPLLEDATPPPPADGAVSDGTPNAADGPGRADGASPTDARRGGDGAAGDAAAPPTDAARHPMDAGAGMDRTGAGAGSGEGGGCAASAVGGQRGVGSGWTWETRALALAALFMLFSRPWKGRGRR